MFSFLLAAAAAFSLQPQWAQIPADDANCIQQQELPWCGGSVGFRPLTKTALVAAEEEVHAFMKTVKTSSADWRSFHREVAQGRRFQGDCDTYVFTVLGRLAAQGYNLSEAMRVLVTTESGSNQPNHMVALVKVGGEWIVFADIEANRPYRLSEARWKPIYSAPIHGTRWHYLTHTETI